MAEVTSTFELKPGATAPPFELPDANGRLHSLSQIASGNHAVVVAFVCNHCPFVLHLADAIGRCATECQSKRVAFVAINPNDVENYPDDAPGKMGAFADAHGWAFPYLYDEIQEVAKAYSAACTPDFYVFDRHLRLVYAGQFDDSRPGNDTPVNGSDLRAAIDAALTGEACPGDPRPSSGCNIKWKPGNAPPYFG